MAVALQLVADDLELAVVGVAVTGDQGVALGDIRGSAQQAGKGGRQPARPDAGLEDRGVGGDRVRIRGEADAVDQRVFKGLELEVELAGVVVPIEGPSIDLVAVHGGGHGHRRGIGNGRERVVDHHMASANLRRGCADLRVDRRTVVEHLGAAIEAEQDTDVGFTVVQPGRHVGGGGRDPGAEGDPVVGGSVEGDPVEFDPHPATGGDLRPHGTGSEVEAGSRAADLKSDGPTPSALEEVEFVVKDPVLDLGGLALDASGGKAGAAGEAGRIRADVRSVEVARSGDIEIVGPQQGAAAGRGDGGAREKRGEDSWIHGFMVSEV